MGGFLGYLLHPLIEPPQPYYQVEDEIALERAFEDYSRYAGANVRQLKSKLYAISIHLPDRTCIQLNMRRNRYSLVLGEGPVYCFDPRSNEMLSRHYYEELG
jgi:hypothetical protein